jgi:hypothetical protein
LLHEEGNKFLSNRASNQQPIIEETHPSDIPAKNFKKLNSENLFDSSFSASNTPTLKSNSSHRKISLQPINPQQNSPRSTNHSPVDLFSNVNKYKKGNFPFSSQSSPQSNFSPKTVTYSSKLTNKATLFDYMVTPIKSPTCKSADTPAIISDFKNRFQQHQQQLMQNYALNQQQQHVNDKSPLKLQTEQIQEEEYVVIDKKDLDECKKMQFLNLGTTIKESLSEEEMSRLSVLAKFYSELILSNLFAVKYFSYFLLMIFFC